MKGNMSIKLPYTQITVLETLGFKSSIGMTNEGVIAFLDDERNFCLLGMGVSDEIFFKEFT